MVDNAVTWNATVMPPVRKEPAGVVTLALDQIEVKSYVGGLVRSFEWKAA
jgi:hypothetical protein